MVAVSAAVAAAAEPSLARARDLVEYLPLLSAQCRGTAATHPGGSHTAATVNATTESSRGNDSGAIFS